MAPIRVLIVDDSVVIRKVLCEALSVDASIEVAGTAADGRIALAKIQQLNPDLVTLDVEMPVMSGLETLPEIRRCYPKLSVIMFSTLTERGAATTLDALALGASDYVTKPSDTGSLQLTLSIIRQELILGIRKIEDIMLSTCLSRLVQRDKWATDPDAFWRHSLGCALVCKEFESAWATAIRRKRT